MPFNNSSGQATAAFLDLKRKQGLAKAKAFGRKHKGELAAEAKRHGKHHKKRHGKRGHGYVPRSKQDGGNVPPQFQKGGGY